MKKHFLFIALGSLLIFTSCNKEDSDTVDQDKIYASYVLEYNSNQDVTFARSNFHFSNAFGTKLELVSPAEITVDGDIIPFKQALAYYEKEYNGVKNSGDFKYVDVDGNTFNNTVTMVPSIDFDGTLDTISRSSNYMLTWVGDPVQTGEVVTVTIDGAGENDTQIFTQTGVGATDINLTQNQLQNLGLENATFYIRRSKNVAAQEVTSAGGNVIARYDGQPSTVYVEP